MLSLENTLLIRQNSNFLLKSCSQVSIPLYKPPPEPISLSYCPYSQSLHQALPLYNNNMSDILFVPHPTDTDAFLSSASSSLLSTLLTQTQIYSYDFLSDTPVSSYSGRFIWEEREETEEECFLEEAREWIEAQTEVKEAYYGFDFEAETPIQTGQFIWETVEKKLAPVIEADRLSLSTMATSD